MPAQPNRDEWLGAARQMYPDATPDDLDSAFNGAYGASPEPKTTDYFADWSGKARELYPDASDDDIKSSFVTRYGDPVEPPGFWSDAGNMLKQGIYQATQHGREALTYAMPDGLVDFIDSIDESWHGEKSPEFLAGKVEESIAALSPEQKAANVKDWWNSEEGTFGDAFGDLRSYGGVAITSLPETAVSMIPGMALGRMVWAKQIAMGATEKVAVAAGARAAMISGSVSEGLLGGGAASMAARDAILALDQGTLEQSEYFQAYRQSDGLSAEDAQKKLAEDGAAIAMGLGSIATATFSGMGDRALFRGIMSGWKGPLPSRMAKGAAVEAGEEVPQSALSKIAENYAVQRGDPNLPLSEGVINEALGGLVGGGILGGGMGVLTRAEGQPVPTEEDPEVRVARQAQAIEQERMAQAGAAMREAKTVDEVLDASDAVEATGYVPSPDIVALGKANQGFIDRVYAQDLPTIDQGRPERPIIQNVMADMQVGAPPAAVTPELAGYLQSPADMGHAPIPGPGPGLPAGPGPGLPAGPGPGLPAGPGPGLPAGPGRALGDIKNLILVRKGETVVTPKGDVVVADVTRAGVRLQDGTVMSLEDYTGLNKKQLDGMLSRWKNADPETYPFQIKERTDAQGIESKQLRPEGEGKAAEGEPLRGVPEGHRPELQDGQTAEKIEVAANQAATSTQNDIPQPTEGQIEAGNYKKGHVQLQGMDISIENPQGSTRSGTDRTGKPWSVKMKDHYGYIKGTVGKDKDHIDVFLGKNAENVDIAYVIDQIDPKTGNFDEHKVVIGATGIAAAKKAYLRNYARGWKGLGAIQAMPMDDFKAWVYDKEKTKKPLQYVKKTRSLGKIGFTEKVTEAETGETLTVTETAEQKLAAIDERIDTLRKLKGCLKR